MKELQPYLIFPGTCQEALDFYVDALDGEIVMLDRYADSPLEVSAEHDVAFEALGQDGAILRPLADSFGMVEDRFRIRWMLAVEESRQKSGGKRG